MGHIRQLAVLRCFGSVVKCPSIARTVSRFAAAALSTCSDVIRLLDGDRPVRHVMALRADVEMDSDVVRTR